MPEPLGRPVINIQRVTFGYPKRDLSSAAPPKSPTADGDGDADGDGEAAAAEAAEAPKPPAEVGPILLNDVDFGVDLETRIGKEG